MNIKARERLLDALIIVAAIIVLFVVGYPHYKETSPSVEITSGKILDGIVVSQQSTMKRAIGLTDKRLGYVEHDGYLLDPYRGYTVYEGNTIILEGLISSIVQAMPHEFLSEKTDFSRQNRS